MSAFLSASVDSVSGCIVKCVENVNVERKIATNANQKPRLTTWVIMASGKPSTSMRRNWKPNSVMLGTPGACGKAFRSLLIVHTSSLQPWHSPLWQTQWRLCMVWSIKQHALTGEWVLWLSGYSWCEKSRLNPQKAAGPVNILGRVLWDWNPAHRHLWHLSEPGGCYFKLQETLSSPMCQQSHPWHVSHAP